LAEGNRVRSRGKGPLVSVIMPSYNESGYIATAIQSVLAQTFDTFELIVVDDASTDGTPEIVASFADPRIRLLVSPSNRGAAACRNAAVENASGSYLALHDADDISEPDRLARQVAFLEANPEIDILGTSTRWIDAKGKTIGVSVPETSHEAICACPLRGFGIAHASIVMRREVMEAIGGYDPELRRSEDYGFLLRCVDDFRFANIRDILYVIRWLPRRKWAEVCERKNRKAQIAYIRRTRQGFTAYGWLLTDYLRLLAGPVYWHLPALRVRWTTYFRQRSQR